MENPKFDALDIAAPEIFIGAFPNPFNDNNTVRYRVEAPAEVRIEVYDEMGKLIKVLVNSNMQPGTYSVTWNGAGMAKGVYFISASRNGDARQILRVVKQ